VSESPDAGRLSAAFNQLISCDEVPSFDVVMALGAELSAAHLDRFAEQAIDQDFGNIPAAILRGMLVAAARHYWSLSTPEERARQGNEEHVRRQLAEIVERGCWPAVRSELIKLFNRVLAELKERTPPDPTETEQPEGSGRRRRRIRGGQQKYDPKADKRLCDNWQAAKRQGMSRDAFAGERGITVQDLIDAQHREKYRRIRDAE
jgi:hypothetical protein